LMWSLKFKVVNLVANFSTSRTRMCDVSNLYHVMCNESNIRFRMGSLGAV